MVISPGRPRGRPARRCCSRIRPRPSRHRPASSSTAGSTCRTPIERLISGLDVHVPVIATSAGTMRTAADLYAVAPRLTRSSTRKVETALRLFDEHVDGPALLDRLDVSPTSVVTPLMFEHQLMDRRPRGGQAHRAARGRGAADPRGGRPAAAPRGRPADPPRQPVRHHAPRPPSSASTSAPPTLVDPHDEPLRSGSRRSMRRCERTRASRSSRRGTWSSTPATSGR